MDFCGSCGSRFALRSPATSMAYQDQPLLGAIPGKVLRLRLKSTGVMLCVNFQTRQCEDPDCQKEHRCAVLCGSGRTCGGQHPAIDCYEKRYLREERFRMDQDEQWPHVGPSSSRQPPSPASGSGPEASGTGRGFVGRRPLASAAHAQPIWCCGTEPLHPPSAAALAASRGRKRARDEEVEIIDEVANLDAEADEVYDQWAHERWSRPGHSDQPEPPSRVKLGPGMGSIFIGPLPHREAAEFIQESRITLVITAFGKPLHQAYAAGRQGWVTCCISSMQRPIPTTGIRSSCPPGTRSRPRSSMKSRS